MSFGSLFFTFGKATEEGKYVPLGCIGVHVDDGIGRGTPEFMDMLKRPRYHLPQNQ